MKQGSRDTQKIISRIDNAAQPLDNIATAGQPEEHLERLIEGGYKTTVDLRMSEECPPPDRWRIAVRQEGMEYVNIPVTHDGVEDETFDRLYCASANRVGPF